MPDAPLFRLSLAGSQQVVSEMRERVGELQRDLEEDGIHPLAAGGVAVRERVGELQRDLEEDGCNSSQVVSEMRERVGELQRDLEEDSARVDEAKEQKGEQEAEINALVEKVKEYQTRISKLVRRQEELREKRANLEADADQRTTKIRKEIVLFSGFTNIRLDVDVKDRFVGTLMHPSGNPELARPVDFNTSAANTTTVAYQLWNMV
ncbi:unnamed protein product [Closterium sp. NIES-65]|nr:unnamed protein product [Closterium sp. NIES-65]CAI5999545.1 unnamed protein product [Closterium sp. NIES-65]